MKIYEYISLMKRGNDSAGIIQRAWRNYMKNRRFTVSIVNADYGGMPWVSTWYVQGDLNNAHGWGVKWDTLFVQWGEGDKVVSFDALYSAMALSIETEPMVVEDS